MRSFSILRIGRLTKKRGLELLEGLIAGLFPDGSESGGPRNRATNCGRNVRVITQSPNISHRKWQTQALEVALACGKKRTGNLPE